MHSTQSQADSYVFVNNNYYRVLLLTFPLTWSISHILLLIVGACFRKTIIIEFFYTEEEDSGIEKLKFCFKSVMLSSWLHSWWGVGVTHLPVCTTLFLVGPPETPEEESPYDYTPEWEGRRRHASLHSSMHYLPAHPPPPDQPLSGIQFLSSPAIFHCYGFVSDLDPNTEIWTI